MYGRFRFVSLTFLTFCPLSAHFLALLISAGRGAAMGAGERVPGRRRLLAHATTKLQGILLTCERMTHGVHVRRLLAYADDTIDSEDYRE